MKDRLKFRAYIEELNELLEVQYINPLTRYVMCDREDGSQEFKSFDKVKIMQCTGLKDKNGKLIYEGDIVFKKGNKDHKGNKMFSTVVWCSMFAEFNISDENGLHRMPSNSNNVEVIGNIYETPELLNKEQE